MSERKADSAKDVSGDSVGGVRFEGRLGAAFVLGRARLLRISQTIMMMAAIPKAIPMPVHAARSRRSARRMLSAARLNSQNRSACSPVCVVDVRTPAGGPHFR